MLVEDQKTGERLIQKQAAAVVPIASITKLMTAMVVLDAGQVLEERISIEAADIDRLLHSRSHLPVGTRLTRKDALLIALMASENRSAHALGRTYPGGYTACVAAMNAKARALGLRETRFSDTTGLSSGNVSSARIWSAWWTRRIRTADPAVYHLPENNDCFRMPRLIFSNTNRSSESSLGIGLSKTGIRTKRAAAW